MKPLPACAEKAEVMTREGSGKEGRKNEKPTKGRGSNQLMRDFLSYIHKNGFCLKKNVFNKLKIKK